MYKVGMYGGSFNPLHKGHVSNIIYGARVCEELYVILSCSNNPNEIPYKIRYRWLFDTIKDMDNVRIITVYDDSYGKAEYNWEEGAAEIKRRIGKEIDLVIFGSDYEGDKIRNLYPDSEVYFAKRELIDISSSQIRENPISHFDYIAKSAQPYYVKRIAVVGTESCGKSRLVSDLALHYDTNSVKEIGREVCDEVGGIDYMIPSDFVEILHKHKANEIEAIKSSNRYLFVDTESTVTRYYLELMYGRAPHEEITLADSISKLNKYDLVLFLGKDVKWVQDGTRTFGVADVRELNEKLLKKLLKEQGIEFTCISGSYLDRMNSAIKAIEAMSITR